MAEFFSRVSMQTRVCTSCQTDKPLAEFHKFGPKAERVGKWCEDCYQKNKARTQNRPHAKRGVKP